MLLRRQKSTREERHLVTLAISLGLATNGYHARSYPVTAHVGENRRLAKARGRKTNSEPETRNSGGYASAIAGR
jgi:hypothetical protein